MASPVISAFLIDEENEVKFEDHGVTAVQVLQVLHNTFAAAKNRRRRRATYLLIGTGDGGQCIAIPVEPTHEFDVWRPVTAWLCKQSEASTLNRLRGK